MKDPDERKVGRAIFDATVELAPGQHPRLLRHRRRHRQPAPTACTGRPLVPAELVPQHVVVLGGDRTVVDSVAPRPSGRPPSPPRRPDGAGADRRHACALRSGRVVGARSGDKGGNANLGVFARTDEAWAWLDAFLTVDAAAHAAAGDGRPRRRASPAARRSASLNFVIVGLLQEGVAASTRQDGQAKSLGEWLRARVVEVPASLLD